MQPPASCRHPPGRSLDVLVHSSFTGAALVLHVDGRRLKITPAVRVCCRLGSPPCKWCHVTLQMQSGRGCWCSCMLCYVQHLMQVFSPSHALPAPPALPLGVGAGRHAEACGASNSSSGSRATRTSTTLAGGPAGTHCCVCVHE